MVKKILSICLLLFALQCGSVFAGENGDYVGIPKGFYDDIDPADIEEETPDNVNRPALRGNGENAVRQSPVYDEDAPYIHIGGESPVKSTEVKPTKDYASIYNNLEPADFSYLHDIDPDQYYDMKDTAWSVYPLFRLNSAIYFKNQTIEPGYYLLTPREHDGKWYMLFKQNGVVKHIIPVYDRDYTPENFYAEHIPKPKLTGAQKVHMGFLGFLGHFDSTKRKEPVKTYLEVNDLENYFISIVIYYGGHKYSTLFRTIRL